MKLVTGTEMRALEQQAFAAGATVEGLMENAGRGVANAIRERFGSARGRRIVVLVGSGNNGGDGLVAARHLYDAGAETTVFLLGPRPAADANLQALQSREIEIYDLAQVDLESTLGEAVDRADAVIDAVLGTGRLRPIEGLVAAALDRLAGRRALVFAVDLPSGLDADTGAVDPHTPRADYTLTLGIAKLGLHTWPGSNYAGEVEVIDIGLEPAYAENVRTELLTADWAREHLPERPLQSNKGTFGRVLVVAGSESYTGAATLACLGALRAGAGLVTLAAIPSVRAAVAANLPEVTFLTLPEAEGGLDTAAGDVIARALEPYDVMLIGSGLGLAPGTQAAVRGLLGAPAVEGIPAVIDADALNTLARHRGWPELLRARAVLTPHPGELSRLSGASVPGIQAQRLPVARRHAEEWRQILVLKGAHTLIATPEGNAFVSPFVNAALATAGTGDVLGGCIAGLIAQGLEPSVAAALGVYLHGAAAELYVDDYGSSGMLAGELGQGIARVAARLRRDTETPRQA